LSCNELVLKKFPWENSRLLHELFERPSYAEQQHLNVLHPLKPNRIYYLEDSEGGANEWCEAIEKAKQECFDT
jgi:PH domain